MSVSSVTLCAILALDLAIGVLMIKNYGELKYMQGKSKGFQESTDLTKKFLNKLIKKADERSKAESKSKEEGKV